MKSTKSKESQIKDISDLISMGNKRIDKIEDKAILILGNTGVGKSTLTYLLAGKQLYSEKNAEDDYVIKSLTELGAIKIADNKYASETRIPNKWTSTDGTTLWDCPGFSDTEGIEQEIANAFYIHRLFETTKNVKFILAASWPSMQGKGSEFIVALNNFTRMFKDVSMLEGSLAVVVTHVPKSKTVANMQVTLGNFMKHTMSTEDSRKILEYVNKLASVFLFPVPDRDQEQISNPELLQQINAATEYIQVTKPFANVAISEKSIDIAHELFDTSNSILIGSLTNLAQMIINRCDVVNNPDNQYVKTVETYVKVKTEPVVNKSIIERIKEVFYNPAHKEVVHKEVVHKTYNKCYKELLDLDDIYAFNDACKGIIKPDVVINGLIQNVNTIFRVLHKNVDLADNQDDIQNSIHEKIKYVQFLELVCNGQKKVDITSLSQIFIKVQLALDEAANKGIKVINISTNEESYVYYEKILQYLELPEHLNDQHCIETKSKALYYMGNIACKEKKDYNLSVNNYVKAIKGNRHCKGFEDIYKKMVDIFHDAPASLKTLDDVDIKEKLFTISHDRFLGILNKISEQIKCTFQEGLASYPGVKKADDKLSILIKHIQYLDHVSSVNKLMNTTKTIGITHNKEIFVQNMHAVLTLIEGEYKKKFDQPVESCKAFFDEELESILFFNNLLKSSKNTEINGCYSHLQKIHNLLKENFIGTIKTINIDSDIKDIDYLERAVEYLSMLPHSKTAIMIKAKICFVMGNIHWEQKNYDRALEDYQISIKLDNGLNDARKCIGAIKFSQGKFIEAYEVFSEIKDFIKVSDCFKKAIEVNPEDPKLREQKGDYLCSIGMHEKAIKSYTEAVSLENNNEARKLIYKKMSDAARSSVKEEMSDHFLNMSNGTLDILPQTNIAGDTDELFETGV